MVLMIMSGWQIYNASPLFSFQLSRSITLGGWLGGALLWHFRRDVAADGQRPCPISRSALPPAASAEAAAITSRRPVIADTKAA
jgi:hypothetical protein